MPAPLPKPHRLTAEATTEPIPTDDDHVTIRIETSSPQQNGKNARETQHKCYSPKPNGSLPLEQTRGKPLQTHPQWTQADPQPNVPLTSK